MVNKLKTIARMPMVSSQKKNYCLVCFKLIPEHKAGLLCDYKTHFYVSHNCINFYTAIQKKFGIVFPLEDEKMVNFFKKDLKKLYIESGKGSYIESEEEKDEG